VAEALTRKRRRRHKAPDPRERELKRLKLSVCEDTGFRLHLATYDQPRQRDELIARVVEDAEAEKVRVTRLDLAGGEPETSLVSLLRAHLQKTDLPSGWRQAVMVTGIEQRLDYSAGPEGFAFLHQANLLRDALPDAVPVPVVLWLSRVASAALPAEAPDLWHWRAANFDFTADEAPRLELLRELTRRRPEDAGGLSVEQQRARVQMLEDLLAELEREGPPKSKRQASERDDLLHQLGRAYLSLGCLSKVLQTAQRQVGIARDIGDPELCRALANLGIGYQAVGDGSRAIESFEEALDVARRCDDRGLEGGVLSCLGRVYRALGEHQRAVEHHEQALRITREIGDPALQASELSNLGDLYHALGEPRRAVEYYEDALKVARAIGDRRLEGWTLGSLGNQYSILGERPRAIKRHERALAIAQDIGDRSLEGWTAGGLGNAYRVLGEPRRAIDYHEKALEAAREHGDRTLECWTLWDLGHDYRDLGEPRRAVQQYERALEVAREIGARWLEASVLTDLGTGYRDLRERERATEAVGEALAIAEETGEANLADTARAQLAAWEVDPVKR
jgi:tetratricopeptide (TPR) repeat protein